MKRATSFAQYIESRKIEMSYDPDEDVTLNGAKMSLRSAVAKVMALSPDDRMGPRFLEMGSRRSWTARRSRALRIYRVSKIIPEATVRNAAPEWQTAIEALLLFAGTAARRCSRALASCGR
jgi:hypothetical protein